MAELIIPSLGPIISYITSCRFVFFFPFTDNIPTGVYFFYFSKFASGGIAFFVQNYVRRQAFVIGSPPPSTAGWHRG
ncbi:hypothetical protein FN846DRAFT_967037 [Sphaerosporella brunnea]|uniref:Uncharacterized protein n=1 Tax=Sphaerosporella brunnea TaxID=1250544 RepID=A0A5J5ELS2_9PEZI|nr:hypothetical protein FN846DRAFT_967037 [Sphaerosporella brunnea]